MIPIILSYSSGATKVVNELERSDQTNCDLFAASKLFGCSILMLQPYLDGHHRANDDSVHLASGSTLSGLERPL